MLKRGGGFGSGFGGIWIIIIILLFFFIIDDDTSLSC